MEAIQLEIQQWDLKRESKSYVVWFPLKTRVFIGREGNGTEQERKCEKKTGLQLRFRTDNGRKTGSRVRDEIHGIRDQCRGKKCPGNAEKNGSRVWDGIRAMGNKCPDKWFMGIGRFSVPVLYLVRLRVHLSGSLMLGSYIKRPQVKEIE